MSVSLAGDVRRDRLVLWVLAVALFLVVAFVSWRYVGTVVLGLFVYYVTRPIRDRIEPRLGNQTLAVVVTIVAVALPVLALIAWTGVVVVQSLTDLTSSAGFDQLRTLVQPYLDLTDVREELASLFEVAVSDPGRLADVGGDSLSDVLGTLVGSLAVLFNVFLHGFIVLVLTFYLLRDDDSVAAWGRDTFAPEGSVVEAYFLAVDRDLKNVYFGNILNALVTGLLGAVVYALLNAVAPPAVRIPEPLLLGLLTGAASLVPVIGMKLVWVPIALVLVVDSLVTDPATIWFPALFAVVSTVVVDYIPDQLLRPYVSGRTLHVGLVMIAYILGPILFGWYGIFLGPLVLVVTFEFGRIVLPWLVHPARGVARETDHGSGAPATRRTVDSIPSGMLVPADDGEPGPPEEPADG